MHACCIYPPFTQPTMMYPSYFVVADCIQKLGVDCIEDDLNARLFKEVLDQLHTDKALSSRLTHRIDSFRESANVLLAPPITRNERYDFLEHLRQPQTYSDYRTYLDAAAAMEISLDTFGKSIGYQRLGLDRFESDADFSAPSSLVECVGRLRKTALATFFENYLQSLGLDDEPLICISCSFRTQIIPTALLVSVARDVYPGALIAVGGAAITCLRTDVEEVREVFSGCDVICFGQAEKAIELIVRQWFSAGSFDPGPIGPTSEAITSRRRSCATSFKERVDDLPWLTRLSTRIANSAKGKYASPQPYVPLPAARGCYWNKCTSCLSG